MDKIQIQYSRDTIHTYIPVADPDLELRKGKGEAGPGFFACPAGISSCYFFFSPKIRGVGLLGPPPLDMALHAHFIATPYKGFSVTRLHNYHTKITKK